MRNSNKVLMLAFLLSMAAGVFAQGEKQDLYDPSLDGMEEIAKLVKQANTDGKHVLLQVGGNW